MNVERVRKWIDALRSGEYQQTTGSLENLQGGQRYNCCLGVLMRVASADPTLSHLTFTFQDPDPSGYVLMNGNSSLPPESVMGEFGFGSERNPHLRILGGNATQANDDGYSFADIAYALEWELANEEGTDLPPIPEGRACEGPSHGKFMRMGRDWHGHMLCLSCIVDHPDTASAATRSWVEGWFRDGNDTD
jgi:hypothetical protein